MGLFSKVGGHGELFVLGQPAAPPSPQHERKGVSDLSHHIPRKGITLPTDTAHRCTQKLRVKETSALPFAS